VVDDLLLAAESADDVRRASAGFLPEVTVATFDGLPGDPTIEMGTGLRRVAGAGPRKQRWRWWTPRRRSFAATTRRSWSPGRTASCSPCRDLRDAGDLLHEPFAGRWALARKEPLAFPASEDWAPAAFREALGSAWVAIVPCGDLRVLVVSRSAGIAFYSGELERLHAFAGAADLILTLKGQALIHGSAPAGEPVALPARAIVLESRVPVF
jgi:hypothetical protein